MTKLLVSVRSADEARIALDSGADLIDVKEPAHGSLGAATPDTISEIVNAIERRVPISVALGELLHISAEQILPLPEVSYLKVGLSGCAQNSNWKPNWLTIMARRALQTRAVAVIYADTPDSPPAEEIFDATGCLGFEAVLVDTFQKGNGDLFSHWSLARVRWFIDKCDSLDLTSVVAGSLRAESIRLVRSLRPDMIAVRGAVCEPSRTGNLVGERVSELARLLHEADQQDFS